MLKKFNEKFNHILTHFEHGIVFECGFAFNKENAIGEVISEAKITDTDDHLLDDLLRLVKTSKEWCYKIYSYEDILALSSESTWRSYKYFKENCNTGFKLFVFVSDFKDVGLLKKEFPSLTSFFEQTGESAFGICWPFNFKETYVWLNRKAILNDVEPKERIQHEMIHAWGGIMNVDEHKSFGKHDAEKKIEKLDEIQQKFIDMNKLIQIMPKHKELVNYCIGQNGLEFESQVNDICDAFGYYFKRYLKNQKNPIKWIKDLLKNANEEIFQKSVWAMINESELEHIYDPDFSGYYQNKVLLFFLFHGLLFKSNKIWYLDEALATHFKEDLALN